MAKRLEILARENAERRRRESLIQTLPESLGGFLENLPWNYLSDLPLDDSAWFLSNNSSDGDGWCKSPNRPSDYLYQDFDELENLIVSIPALDSCSATDRRVYLCLGGEGPLFESTPASVLHLIPEFLRGSSGSFCGFVSRESPFVGLVVEQYCGFLPEDRKTNDREVVFELSHWGFATSADDVNPRNA